MVRYRISFNKKIIVGWAVLVILYLNQGHWYSKRPYAEHL